jgi:hypothetical protein
MNNKDILKGIMGANKQPALLSYWDARQYCPKAIITNQVLPYMETFKVHCDSLQKFLKQDITHIYIDPMADRHRTGEATLIAGHVVIVQCILNRL